MTVQPAVYEYSNFSTSLPVLLKIHVCIYVFSCTRSWLHRVGVLDLCCSVQTLGCMWYVGASSLTRDPNWNPYTADHWATGILPVLHYLLFFVSSFSCVKRYLTVFLFAFFFILIMLNIFLCIYWW